MSIHKRTAESEYSKYDIGTGPYLARVVSHFDPTFMGNLEVTLLRQRGNIIGEDTQTYIVKYASPFFGYTAHEYMGKVTGDTNMQDGFSDTQKSYGMWMIPPDPGVTVMVMFIEGDPAQGYWMGCVPDSYANRMVPGIAASDPNMYEMDGDHKGKYAPKDKVPVGEINRRINGTKMETDPTKIKKPTHPIVRWFYEEGLMDDSERGVTTASARRDSPSMVFGISSPGPLHRKDCEEKPGKKGKIGTQAYNTDYWVSRLGGTQFVMDDGDITQNRSDHPSLGKMEYVDDPGGKRWIPKDELFRIRTRTGHQILFHNSEDFIYIGNSRGTSWIEMSSDGKIDVYARDSVSIHSQNDLNLRADRDINMEAGRNINMKATAEYKNDEHKFHYDGTTENIDVRLYDPMACWDNDQEEAGRIQMESTYNFNMLCGRNMKIQLHDPEIPCCGKGLKGHNNLWIKVQGDMKLSVRDPDIADGGHDSVDELDAAKQGLHVVSYKHCHIETGKPTPDPLAPDTGFDFHLLHHGDTYIKTVDFLDRPGNLDIYTKNNTHIEQGNHIDIKSGGHHWEKTGATNETLAGGNIIETAPNIHMNGPQAAAATSAKHADPAELAIAIKQFVLYENDITDETLAWAGTRYQSPDKLKSIMRRIPMHEPWKPKENLDPLAVKPPKTDREENHGKGPC